MSLEQKFRKACDEVKKFSKKPPDSQLLEIYGLFKQATVGDIDIPVPMDPKSNAKWKAWNGKKGMDQELSKKKYIEKVEELAHTYQ